MRRGIALARDYCHRRQVFGKKLASHPLHLTTIAGMEVEFRGALQFVFYTCLLLGKSECKIASESEELLSRLLVPLVKLYTAKQSIANASEVLESFGGIGYMEDSDLPRLLRDTQVTSIWEGTTNVLALDVWRVFNKSPNTMDAFINSINSRLNIPPQNKYKKYLEGAANQITESQQKVRDFMNDAFSLSADEATPFIESSARHFAFTLSRVYVASLLFEQATWSGRRSDAVAVERWCNSSIQNIFFHKNTSLVQLSKKTAEERYDDWLLALDVDENTGKPRGYGDKMSNGVLRAKY